MDFHGRDAAQIKGMGASIGQVRAGYLSDLLLVDGAPLAVVAMLQDRQKLRAIMKNGEFWKEPPI